MKPKQTEGVHQGHRERLKHRLLEAGLKGFEDHTLLELLLFHAIPQADTNPTGHHLVTAFGSLRRTFNASYLDLLKVEGIGEKSAFLIYLSGMLARAYMLDFGDLKKDLSNKETLLEVLRPLFIGWKTECVYVICMDDQCNYVVAELISSGTVGFSSLQARQLSDIAAKHGVRQLILAHNHPNETKFVSASYADIHLTQILRKTLRELEINIYEHVILGPNPGNEVFMMRGSIPLL